MVKSISITPGGNKKLELLAKLSGNSQSAVIENLINREFVALFGEVDPDTVSVVGTIAAKAEPVVTTEGE